MFLVCKENVLGIKEKILFILDFKVNFVLFCLIFFFFENEFYKSNEMNL